MELSEGTMAAARTKRSEMTDISAALRTFASKGRPTKEEQAQRRQLFQKVIQYLTIGIDMSPVFSDVIMNAHTTDVATKKMLYHYITHYAQANADLALLTVNTLQKDCREEDPVIRGLALRSMASMRVPDLVEYLVRAEPRAESRESASTRAQRNAEFDIILLSTLNLVETDPSPTHSPISPQIDAIRLGLKDADPYPRKTAALGVLKVHDLAPEALAETEILEEVRRMLISDRDASVVANCLIVLREIDGERALATKQNVYGLINRIKDFTQWSQVTILETVALYKPADKSETFDVMNALEDRLQSSNSAVVLGTVKVFLHATLDLPDVHQQVFERLKAPLFTLANAGAAETAYAVWAHLHLLTMRAPPLFAMDYKSFFCRGSDAPAVKKLKIEMLTAVADDVNTYDIVSELCEYVTDVDAVIAREGVRAVGRIALDGDQNVAGIVDRLLQFIEYNQEHITAETLVQVKDLVRKHPRWIDQCVVAVSGIELETIVEPEAKAALVYLYGEFGQAMPEAPYMLEPLLDEFDEEESEEVRLELLASAMKLFFKRAPEMRDMLGKALAAGTNDANQDVHDRALMYARLLHQDPEAASRVIAGYKESVANFSDGAGFADKFGEQIFDEFNSLSVLYRKPAFLFTDDKPVEVPRTPDVIEAAGGGGGGSAMMGDSLIDFGDEPVGASSSRSAIDDLLGMPAGGGGGGGGGGSGPGSSHNLLDLLDVPMDSASVPAAPPPPLVLRPAPSLDAATFQARWAALPPAPGCVSGPRVLTLGANAPAVLTAPPPLMSHLATRGFATMASGGAPSTGLKYYFYAQAADGAGTFLVEAVVNPVARAANVVLKTDAGDQRGAAAEDILAEAMASFAA